MTENSKITFKLGRLIFIVGVIVSLAATVVMGYGDIEHGIKTNLENIEEVEIKQKECNDHYEEILYKLGKIETKVDILLGGE